MLYIYIEIITYTFPLHTVLSMYVGFSKNSIFFSVSFFSLYPVREGMRGAGLLKAFLKDVTIIILLLERFSVCFSLL